MRPSLRLGLWVTLVAFVGIAVSGDIQARIMTEQQPMKMAAAEALYNTSAPASFSIFTIGSLDGSEEVWSVRIPRLLSLLATQSPDGEVEGINNIQSRYEQTYGPGDYRPIIPVTYWTFRLMIGFGALAALAALVGLWLTRRGRLPDRPWVWRAGAAAVVLPFLANSAGWVFTEMGRQPWTVFGQFQTGDSVSPSVGAGMVATSLVAFTVLYGVLAVVEVWLLAKFVRSGPPTEAEALSDLQPPTTDEGEAAVSLVY
jgi:cytochrome d ubiquinol oxidase subunit I